jgi:CRP-like cAMP-binding protein
MPDASPDTRSVAFDRFGEVREVRGGASIEMAGDLANSLYRLSAGRIAALEERSGAPARVAVVHRPGAILCGHPLLAMSRQPYTLTALRDSQLQTLPRHVLEPWLRSRPGFVADLARASLEGLEGDRPADQRTSSILGFIAVCDSVEMRGLVEALAKQMRADGLRVVVLGAEFDGEPSSRLSAIEAENDLVLMAAERQEADFTQYCGRQIDRLILVDCVEKVHFRFCTRKIRGIGGLFENGRGDRADAITCHW